MNKRSQLLIVIVVVLSLGMYGSSSLAQNINRDNSTVNPGAGQWFVSARGNDSNNCASPVTACATIQAANSKAASGDTIYVDSGTYMFNGHGTEVLRIGKDLTFSGGWDETFSNQAGKSTIDGEGIYMCIVVEYDHINVIINRFKITKCGGPVAGGITNWGKLILQNTAIQNNPRMGIDNYKEGDLTLVDTIVRDNVSSYGGGVQNDGKLTLIRSTITGNSATNWGGGIRQTGQSLILINSTISGNSADQGGGIYNESIGEIKIYNSTIINNVAKSMIGGLNGTEYSTVWTQNSIIAENHLIGEGGASDCTGTINSGGYNLIGSTVGCTFNASTGDLLNVKPHAIPIQSYFGLLPSSPAIDAGNPAGCLDDLGNPIIDDERGGLRPLDGNKDGTTVCDIGAYELDPDHPIQMNYLAITSKPCPILYFDDFSNPNSGWPIADTGNSLFEYNNGEYRILERYTQKLGVVRPGFQAQDYIVSVDLRNVTGVIGSYGIAFSIAQDWSGWYTLEIYPDGWYGVYRYDQYGGAILAEANSPSIKQGTATNHISVERSGTSIKAYANGQLLASLSDTSFSGSLYLGLINYTYNQPNVDIRYDNFKVDPTYCTNRIISADLSNGWQGFWYEKGNNSDSTQYSFTKHEP